MKIYRPLWAEGVLLSPQHFQQQNQYADLSRLMVAGLSGPYAWGVERVAWDEGSLETGKLKLDELKAVFPDGSLVDTVNIDILPAVRDLKSVPEQAASFTVLLGLPVLRADGRNFRPQDEEIAHARRYFGEYVQVADMFSDNSEEILAALHCARQELPSGGQKGGLD